MGAQCKCHREYAGANCSKKCPVDANGTICGGNGSCELRDNRAKCKCNAGYSQGLRVSGLFNRQLPLRHQNVSLSMRARLHVLCSRGRESSSEGGGGAGRVPAVSPVVGGHAAGVLRSKAPPALT